MTAIPHPLHSDAHHDADDHAHAHPEFSFVKKYLFSTDHKVIGLQFLFLGLMFFVVGGLLALVVRWQLAWPNNEGIGLVGKPVPILAKYMGWQNGVMPPDYYTAAFTMHASVMIFFVIIPLLVGTFGNYLIPLKIGAPDMAFPFLNGVAFWTAVPAGGIIVASFFLPGGPAAAGWTSYPTLSEIWQNAPHVEWAVPPSGWDQFVASYGTNSLSTSLSILLHGWWEQFVMFLRIHDAPSVGQSTINGGTWPAIALVTNFASLFLCFSFICAYTVRLGFRPLNWAVSAVASALAAWVALKGVQYAAFDGQSAWFLSIFLLGFSSILGAVNYLTTIIKLRCPGMTMFRLPLSVWSLFITSILVLLATPVLAGTLLMNLLDHHRLTNFFVPFNWTLSNQLVEGFRAAPSGGYTPGGGYPILHQHLFWFYSHPAVYIMILPGMGMVSDILAVFSRKPIFGYRPMVYALAGIAFLGFIVWAHHMFQSGMNPTLGTTFAISTMFIAVPSAIKVFNWLGTLWGGNIRFTTPMLHALSFVALFVIGGLSGIFMASTSVDVHIHDTYFIVAHIHYVLFGGSTFAIFAAITFWYPKMFGRMMNETAGKIHWLLSFVFFNGTFFLMHVMGASGFPRRVADYTNYPSFRQYVGMNQFITYCALGLGLAQLLFAVNFIGSWLFGAKASRNPWEATTLEWETPSPPPHGNFARTPVVHHGPYEYATPLVEEDYLLQTRWVEGVETLAAGH